MMKTYISRGLLEWHAKLKVDRAYVIINFTGGSMSSGGLVPGRFSTDNPALQKIIESSVEFKTNKIARICLPSQKK